LGQSSADTEDEESTPKTAVEAVLFSPSDANQLITGTLEGSVTIWDIPTHVSIFLVSMLGKASFSITHGEAKYVAIILN
jgi:hypothetical protein